VVVREGKGHRSSSLAASFEVDRDRAKLQKFSTRPFCESHPKSEWLGTQNLTFSSPALQTGHQTRSARLRQELAAEIVGASRSYATIATPG